MYIKKSISVRYLSIRTHASLSPFIFLKLTFSTTIILGYCFCLAGKSCLTLLVAPWTVTCQAPLSMQFPRQEYWSGLPFRSSGDLSDSGIKPTLPGLAGRFFTLESPGKPNNIRWFILNKLDLINCICT